MNVTSRTLLSEKFETSFRNEAYNNFMLENKMERNILFSFPNCLKYICTAGKGGTFPGPLLFK